MLLWPAWALDVCGWNHEGPTFFPEQSGVFLLIFGGIWLVALWRRPVTWLLAASKAVAVVFLVAEYSLGHAPQAAILAAVLDGLMGTAAAAALLWELAVERRRATFR